MVIFLKEVTNGSGHRTNLWRQVVNLFIFCRDTARKRNVLASREVLFISWMEVVAL